MKTVGDFGEIASVSQQYVLMFDGFGTANSLVSVLA